MTWTAQNIVFCCCVAGSDFAKTVLQAVVQAAKYADLKGMTGESFLSQVSVVIQLQQRFALSMPFVCICGPSLL